MRVQAKERRREVNVRSGLFLDRLDDRALAPGDYGVQLVVDFTAFGMQPSEFIEHDKQTQTSDGNCLAGATDDQFAHPLGLESAPCLRVDAVRDRDTVKSARCVDDGDMGEGLARNVVKAATNIRLQCWRRGGGIEDLMARDLDSGTNLDGTLARTDEPELKQEDK